MPALEREALVVRPSERSAGELTEALDQLATGDRFVLAVDQFEELFAAGISEDERRAFIDVLVDEAWNPERRALILLALRADFFGRVAPYVELADLVGQNHVLLGPMSASELRRAVEGPAARAGLAVEPALVDTLVDEVAGEAGGLPLLSTALLDLWRDRENGSLTVAGYERSGGVRGAVGRHAEAAFRSLGEDERDVARRIILRLVAGGDGEVLTRRRVTRSELGAADDERVAQVLKALVERRLLVADNGTVELVHEALLEHWPRLAGWLAEGAHGRVLHRHLTQAALEWDGAGRDEGELYRGARLAGALDWADAHAPELNRLESEFLDESRGASERATARRQRANRRLRLSLVLALTLLALSIAAAVRCAAAKEPGAETGTRRRRTAPRSAGALRPKPRPLPPARSRGRKPRRLGCDAQQHARRAPAQPGRDRRGARRKRPPARRSAQPRRPHTRRPRRRQQRGLLRRADPAPNRAAARVRRSVGLLVGAVQGPLHGLAFSGDGRDARGGQHDSDSATVELVDAQTHAPLGPYAVSPDTPLTADVAFAPDGRTFATGEPINGTMHPPPASVVSWDARTANARARTGPIAGGRLTGYTRDGRSLLVVSGERRSLLLDARTLKRLRTFPVGGAAALSPSADEAAFGHADGTVTLLELGSGKRKQLFGQSTAPIETISFSRDGKMLASGAADGGIGLWRVRTGLSETLHGHSASVHAAVFSPDGRTLYTASNDGSVIAWDVSGSRRLGQPFRYADKSVRRSR